MERRKFLTHSLAGLAAGWITPQLRSLAMHLTSQDPIPRRPYARGEEISIIGFGGIVLMGLEQRQADRVVAEMVGRGINYFDVAPSYGGGEAEIKLGPALAPHRGSAFLACKTLERTAKGAQADLERSLKRLKTDHIDLYQLHAVTSMEDVEVISGPGGAMETFHAARERGDIRYMGFSAHSEEAALALMDRFTFNSLLFPTNIVCFRNGSFGPRVVARAKEKGVARLALKAMAYAPWGKGEEHTYPKCWYKPIDDPALAALALRFTLSQDITAALPPGDERLFRMALDIAAGFTPLTENEQKELERRIADTEPLFSAAPAGR